MGISLDEFAHDFRNRVRHASSNEENEAFLTEGFTQLALDSLAEAGEISDAEVCSYVAQGARLSGFELDEEDEYIDLFIAIRTDNDPPERIEKAKIDTAVRQLVGFYSKCADGLYQKMEESLPAFWLAQQIYRIHRKDGGFSRIRFFLITDGLYRRDQAPEPPTIGSASVSVHIWDIERFYRWHTSGRDREEIEVDFTSNGEAEVPCLVLDQESSDYISYLAAVPASILVSIYGQYGPRLLERNVRSFLQAKGGINKGIRETILQQPGRFFAYNNGITATAAAISLKKINGVTILHKATDLQIVNGGQTTASLFRAARKDEANIAPISVSMKLSVVRRADDIDELVGKISKYANSQNKVNAADLSANDPFHRRIEELSRTQWAPARAGAQHETRWFYERARAQYIDELSRRATPAQRKSFEREFPRDQKFEKTDLGWYEQSWDQLPHIVSRGRQKNFVNFTERLEARGHVVPDAAYFQALISRKILWDSTDAIVRKEKYDAYKINIVTYTIALLSHLTARRLDLSRIWSAQSLPQELEKLVRKMTVPVQEVVAHAPRGNISDWQKSEACWEKVRSINLKLPDAVKAMLVESKAVPTIDAPNEQEAAEIATASAVEGATWKAIASWAKNTGSLAPWQRSLSYSLGRLLDQGRKPSIKQARQGLILLTEARRLGFEEHGASDKGDD